MQNITKKEMKKKSESTYFKNNFADYLQRVEDLVDCHTFAQEVFR